MAVRLMTLIISSRSTLTSPEALRGPMGTVAPQAAGSSTGFPSVATEHDVSPLAKAICQRRFHPFRLFVRHGIQVLVQLRHEALAVLFHDPRRLAPGLVVLESLLRRKPRHAHVVPRLPIAPGVPEVDDVHVMVASFRHLSCGTPGPPPSKNRLTD